MSLDNAIRPLMVCNLSYLENFSGGDKSFIRQMIELFLKQVPTELKNLQLGVGEHDFSSVKQTAHKLKSSVSLLGAESMALRLKQIEDAAQTNDSAGQILTLHHELFDLFKEAEQELNYILETL